MAEAGRTILPLGSTLPCGTATASRHMSPDEVASCLSVSKESDVHANVMRIIADQGSRRRAQKKSRKLTLSIKARETAEEKQAVEEYGSSDSGASLGDILGAALAKRESDDDDS